MAAARNVLERFVLTVNGVLVLGALIYLLGDSDSIVRQLIQRTWRAHQAKVALRRAWEEVSHGGYWYNPPQSAVPPDTVVVFSDYECPYCRQLHRTLVEVSRTRTLPAIRYRQFPLPMHDRARLAARIAVCAARSGDFMPVHRYLMETSAWQTEDSSALTAAIPVRDTVALIACLESSYPDRLIADDSAVAARLAIRGTPTIVTHGYLVEGGLTDSQIERLTRPKR